VLTRGQHVLIQPTGRTARIRTIQCYSDEVEQAVPGLRVALNLPDLQVADNAHGTDAIGRGDVVTLPELGRASDTIDAMLEVSGRATQARPLKEATLVRLHHGSTNTPAFVYLQGASALAPGQRVAAQLRMESPVFTFACDRFILRDWTEQQTIAGGIVLDPAASRRGFRTEQRRAFLDARARQPHDAVTFVRTELERDGAAPATALLVNARFSASQVATAISRLATQKEAIIHGPVVANASWWSSLRAKAVEIIEQAHRSSPQEPGMRLTDLRNALGKQMGRTDVFEALTADLCASECAKTGVTIRRAQHRPTLPPKLQPAGARLRAVLAAGRLDPPARKDLAADSLSQQALRFLVQCGEAVEVGPEIVLWAEHYRAAVETVRALISRQGSATVSEMKQALNTSRRIMVPLAEKLDRDGITLRQGDQRTLRPLK
jgi:selenocysteine-specific elongation factor